jgi:multidrug efflux pump subunit AcrA (membrane-fusion protein)
MKRFLLIAVLLASALAAGCRPGPEDEATPTPIPTSVVPDKPTYVVQRGDVQNLEQFSARVSPVREENLFFKRSGYVKVTYSERGDWVETGTLLAELELEDLMNQLSLAQVDLQTTEHNYTTAVEAHQRRVYQAQMNLETLKVPRPPRR